MKIAILTPGGVDRSGTERVMPWLLWFIERLVKCGDEVHVFALRQEPEPGEWPLLGATIHNAGGSHPLLRAWRTFRTLQKEHRRAPFDVIHALWAVPQGVVAAVARKVLGIPVLLHLPGGDVISLPDIHYGGRSTRVARMALNFAISRADRVAAPSAAMVALAQTAGIAAERMPFGVALDRWPIRAPRPRLRGTRANLLHVADLSPVKDQETLLMAMVHLRARNVPFVLDIVGEDQLGGAIARRVQALHLESSVRLHGFRPQRLLKDFMNVADLLVVSSRHEAGPVVALEAAATGVPTVGTHVGLLADWSPDAARTVAVGDAVALANEIADLLSHEDERLRLAAEARKRTVAENADVTTRNIRRVYRSMMAKG